MTVAEKGQPQFFSRVGSLPVVTDALMQMTSLYDQTRGKSRLLRLAEISVLAAVSTAKPVVSRLEKPIEVLDSFACDRLDKFEQSYPIILKPTNKVYDATLKPTVDKVLAIKNIGTDKLGDVQGYTTGKLNEVKELTSRTVSGVGTYAQTTIQRSADRALQNPIGHALLSGVGQALNVTDRYVDYYLPVVEEEEEEDEDETDKKEIVSNKEEGETEPNPLYQAVTVGSKVYQRLGHRLSKQLKNLQVRSQESVKQLNFTVSLIDYAKSNLDGVQERVSSAGSKVKFWWEEINKEEEQGTDAEKSQVTTGLEARVLARARQVTRRLKSGIERMRTVMPVLPKAVQSSFSQATNYVQQLYNSFSNAKSFQEIPQLAVQQMKVQVAAIQDTLSTVTQYISSLYSNLWARVQRNKIPETKNSLEVELEVNGGTLRSEEISPEETPSQNTEG